MPLNYICNAVGRLYHKFSVIRKRPQAAVKRIGDCCCFLFKEFRFKQCLLKALPIFSFRR